MAFISDSDRTRIVAALRAAEAKTSGELIAVVARHSDTYLLVPILAAAGIALLLPGLLWLAGAVDDFLSLYAIQLGAFALLSLGLSQPVVAMRLVPGWVQSHRAQRAAYEAFFRHNLYDTQDRTGVLIFVSVAEHHVEIIADAGIHAAVTPGTWDTIVADFTNSVRSGRVGDGFVTAIDAVGKILAERAPRGAQNRNELPDRLIEI